jgi:meiosis arrest female protein 1
MNPIPKREQTKKEVSGSRKFAEECIELFTHVGHVPGYRLAYNKFIPAYHQYFGRQCKTSDYGFTKLIDLFQAISSTVKVQKI